MSTFLTVYNDLETLVKEGEARIDEALVKLAAMESQLEDGDEVSRMNAVQAREKASERKRFIFFLGSRLQSQIKLLQHHCFANDIPAEQPLMWTAEETGPTSPFVNIGEDLD